MKYPILSCIAAKHWSLAHIHVYIGDPPSGSHYLTLLSIHSFSPLRLIE